jgi:hypothetical protein
MKLILFFYLFFQVFQLSANYKAIDQFDKTFYFPQDHGLEDLYFEVHHNKLLENFKKNFSLGDLKELYYKVYWLKGNKADIEVVGLPEGFKELKDQLKMFIIERLDFVLPVKFKERYAEFKFVEKQSAGKTILELNSDSVTSEYSNLILEFNDKNLLDKVVSKESAIRSESVLTYKQSDVATKAFVVDEVVTEKLQGIHSTKLSFKLKYEKFSSFAFPVSLEAEGIQSLSKSVQTKEKSEPMKESWSIAFKNYKVNSGEASRFFNKKKTK